MADGATRVDFGVANPSEPGGVSPDSNAGPRRMPDGSPAGGTLRLPGQINAETEAISDRLNFVFW